MARSRSRRATIPDVARHAGVGQATAARVLGGYGSFSEATRDRVLDAASALGYTANGIARSMVSGRTNTISAIVAELENPYFSKAVRGISDAVAEGGMHAILANTDENLDAERAACEVFRQRQVDGMVAAPATADVAHLVRAAEGGTPVVLLDRRVTGVALDSVVADNRKAARTAVRRLLDAGHTRIAAITSAPPAFRKSGRLGTDLWSTSERLLGFRQALKSAGVTLDDSLVRHVGNDRERARDAVTALLAGRKRPTALFTTDIVPTVAAYEATQELGVSMPGELSMIGFDDAEWTTLVRPRLTVVAQPAYDLGRLAAQTLLERLHDPERPVARHTLACTLIERDTVGPPPDLMLKRP